jgi:lipopolysaccharide export system protein LptA
MVNAVQAQRPSQDTSQAVGKILDILKADRLNMQSVDSLHKYISAAGHVHVRQEKTDFFADSVILNQLDNSLEAFGNIHINDADSIHTYSQYLQYLGKEKKAFLKNKVRLTDGKGTLTTDELEYDVTVKIGTYLKGGKVVNKKTTLTSKEGYYYGDTKDVIFKQKVVLIDPEYKVITDTLQYNTNTEIANFTSPTQIYSDSGRRVIRTRQGYFDMRNKKGILNKRSVIEDSTYTFTADDMAVDDSTKLGEFRGNAVYRGKDTAQGFDLIANNIKTDRKKDILLATEKPILLIKQGRDSIFVSADTLYTARLTELEKSRPVPQVRDSVLTVDPKDSTRNKYFEAYYHVKVYSDSLQAVGDSLFYSLQDSVFRLFKSPIVWAKENQLTGDTIYLFIRNKKPERLYVFENAMAISRVDSTQYYNQVKGRLINALFTDGKISSLRAKGAAENIYYGQDERKKFIGVNKSNADVIDVLFDESKPRRVSFLSSVDGTMYPMRQVNHEEIRIRGFKWLEGIRPKSKFDILSN